MPVTINAGPEQKITVNALKDLENKALTVFNLGKEIASHFNRPLSEVPENIATSVQYRFRQSEVGRQHGRVQPVRRSDRANRSSEIREAVRLHG